MDNLVERYYDPSTDVTYDWDEEFQCYVGYIESKVNHADPFYYMYLDDDPEEVMHTPHLVADMSSTNDVLDLLGPKKKILSKATQLKSQVKFASQAEGAEEDESDIYGIGEKAKNPATPKHSAKDSSGKPSMDDIRQELRAEVLQAAKEGQAGAAGRRSLTRRLTRKLTTIGGAMTMQEQLNLIADVKKEAGDLVIDDHAINEETAKENAAAHAREIAMQHLSKKPAPSPAVAKAPPPAAAESPVAAVKPSGAPPATKTGKAPVARKSDSEVAAAPIGKKLSVRFGEPASEKSAIESAPPNLKVATKTLSKTLVKSSPAAKKPTMATPQPAPS